MKYLVTGAEGFLGSRLVTELERRGHLVYGIDMIDGDLSEVGVFQIILEREAMFDPIDAVIHLAAQPGRVFGENDIERTITLNAKMTTLIAKACGELGVRLIYTSTSEVYGDAEGHELDEVDVPQPKNLYGLTKLWGEQVCELYAPDDLLIVRPTMPYGPGMEVGYGRAALPTFLSNLSRGMPIEVHAGAKRSWCFITDLIVGFAFAIENCEDHIINVGRDDDLRTMLEVAHRAAEITGADPDLISESTADETITLVKNLSTKRLYDLGFVPIVPLRKGMQRTYEELLDAKAMMEA
jgi:dTDP-glucose 4,6-dehydratase